MGQGNVGYGLDFCHLEFPQIRLPLMEPIERIIVGAQVLRQPAMPSNSAVEHPTEGDTIDLSRMDAEANDPARVLIHKDQDPVGPQRCRLALEQIHAPQAVFHVWDVERQGDLLGDSRTAPIGITLLHFDDRMNEIYARSFRTGLPTAIRGEEHPVLQTRGQ
jgi:hypothetical protein